MSIMGSIRSWPYGHLIFKKTLHLAFVLLIMQAVFNLRSVTADPAKGESREQIKNICGKIMWEDPKGRIVGGTQSKFAQWPWMGGLFSKQRYGYHVYWCGATLLNNNWALTAAHCVKNATAEDLFLSFGDQDMSIEDEALPYHDVNVSAIVIHPKYDPRKKLNDIALLSMKTLVPFQPHIHPACLPENDDNTYAGETAMITGWGATFHMGPAVDALLEVEVPVIPNVDCAKKYAKSKYKRYIEDTVLCAGKNEGAVDACQGDSGGPMVINQNQENKFVLIGVTSWGEGCGEANKPGVYTRVSKYLDWINSIIW